MLKLGGISSNGKMMVKTYFCTECREVIGKTACAGFYYPDGWNEYRHCPYCGTPLYEQKQKQETKIKTDIVWIKEN